MAAVVPSRSTTTKGVFAAASTILSAIVSSVTSETTVIRLGALPAAAHVLIGWFGSASITVTSAPWAIWVARTSAEVVLPAPPFGETKTIDGIEASMKELAGRYRAGKPESIPPGIPKRMPDEIRKGKPPG